MYESHEVIAVLAAHGIDYLSLSDEHQDMIAALHAADTEPEVIAHLVLGWLKFEQVFLRIQVVTGSTARVVAVCLN